MTTKIIRRLSPEETEQALNLAAGVFIKSVAPYCTDDGIDEFLALCDADFYTHRMGDGELTMLGAFEDDQLLGCACLDIYGRLLLLYVEAEHQKRGIGTMLLKKAILDLHDRGALFTSVKVESPPSSATFFIKQGFTVSGPATDETGIPVVPMTLERGESKEDIKL